MPAEKQPVVPGSSPSFLKRLLLRRRLVIFIFVGLLLLLLILFLQNRITTLENETDPESFPVEGNEVIEEAGREKIYQSDYEYEVGRYPARTGKSQSDIRRLIVKKIIDESKFLQQAEKAGIVTLDETIFNSPQKDYGKRIQVIQQIKEKNDPFNIYESTGTFNPDAEGIEGYVVTVWFYNDEPAMRQDGQAFALSKISPLFNKVKEGTMTVQQAAEEIKNDASLAEIDKQYKANAIFPFSVKKGERITVDSKLDNELWKSDEGGLTSLVLAKAVPQNQEQEIDAFYAFGVVTKRY